jgi:hypothetical protein
LARPFLLAQLSDPQIGAEWFDDQSVHRLAAAVESARAVDRRALHGHFGVPHVQTVQ